MRLGQCELPVEVTVLICVEVEDVSIVTVVCIVLMKTAGGWSSVRVVAVLTVSRTVAVEGARVVVFVFVQKGILIVLVVTSFRNFTQFTACG